MTFSLISPDLTPGGPPRGILRQAPGRPRDGRGGLSLVTSSRRCGSRGLPCFGRCSWFFPGRVFPARPGTTWREITAEVKGPPAAMKSAGDVGVSNVQPKVRRRPASPVV